MRTRRMLAAMCGLGFVVASCGGSAEQSQTGAPAVTDSTTSASTAVPAGDSSAVAAPPVMQFTAPLVGGGQIDAAALAGKPTVFWFWAPT